MFNIISIFVTIDPKGFFTFTAYTGYFVSHFDQHPPFPSNSHKVSGNCSPQSLTETARDAYCKHMSFSSILFSSHSLLFKACLQPRPAGIIAPFHFNGQAIAAGMISILRQERLIRYVHKSINRLC